MKHSQNWSFTNVHLNLPHITIIYSPQLCYSQNKALLSQQQKHDLAVPDSNFFAGFTLLPEQT